MVLSQSNCTRDILMHAFKEKEEDSLKMPESLCAYANLAGLGSPLAFAFRSCRTILMYLEVYVSDKNPRKRSC